VVTPPARNPDSYIAIPPSVESATHRIARPETAAPPAPPGTVSEEPVAEETRVAPVASAGETTRWSLVLPDGSRLSLDGPVLLGRDPAPLAGRPDARPVPVVDPGKTVSKTHLLLEPAHPADHGIRVQDLHSTNGVAISAGGVRTVLAAGGEGLAPVGATIELGSFTLLVDAR
jgi:pSer/pThr/pTyr-binding forkhead associated (FHA) protein